MEPPGCNFRKPEPEKGAQFLIIGLATIHEHNLFYSPGIEIRFEHPREISTPADDAKLFIIAEIARGKLQS